MWFDVIDIIIKILSLWLLCVVSIFFFGQLRDHDIYLFLTNKETNKQNSELFSWNLISLNKRGKVSDETVKPRF
jgi:hypothetical protein